MYKNILVPLDGSELAECVLPHVEAIVKGSGTATINFLRIVESSKIDIVTPFVSAEIQKKAELERIKSAKEYLEGVAQKTSYNGERIKKEVLSGPPADTIADYAKKKKIDLIVIATHGRSGISRWTWGSVADRLLRSSQVPVMIVRAPGSVAGI